MKLITILFVISASAMAAGDGHGGGSPLDLKWAFLNTILLFSFLAWKLKGPMNDMFTKNAKDVAELYDFASSKEKEAQIRLESLEKKMSNLDTEKQKIIKDSESETEMFIQKNKQDLNDYIQRIESDVEVKLATEKSMLETELNNNLIDEVIKSAKQSIQSNPEVVSKVDARMLGQVR